MTTLKRFWTDVTVTGPEGRHTIALDGRVIKTPAKADLYVPTKALAEAVADEWRGQSERVDPKAMPLTRYANSVIDGIIPNRAAVVETVAAYGGTDLLCYRADTPDTLIARQSERWNPLLDWARTRFDAPLIQVEGVMYAEQPAPSLARLKDAVAIYDAFALAGLHDLVAISGSLVIGLAIAEGHVTAEEGFALSRLDEDWQIEHWGVDEDAAVIAAKKAREFGDAARLITLLK